MEKRLFSKEFKRKIVDELESGRPVAEVVREFDLKKDIVYRWRAEYRENPDHAFAGKGNPVTEEARITQLEQKIGHLYLENEFLKRVNFKLQSRLSDFKKTR